MTGKSPEEGPSDKSEEKTCRQRKAEMKKSFNMSRAKKIPTKQDPRGPQKAEKRKKKAHVKTTQNQETKYC